MNAVVIVAAVKAGIPETVPGITVHRNCTSSMSSIQMGYYQIKCDEADAIMAGGTDSMSNAQYLACEIALGLNRDITNVNGGNIGLGHPVGATGARITTTLLYEMKKRKSKLGLSALCAGGGMGTSLILEAV
ncbi:MAG: beta-ketoacyl synthase N-terminal-like domain-containing protein [Desulfobacula sp.]|jgi:acetyl-CoA C-acetyltransferase